MRDFISSPYHTVKWFMVYRSSGTEQESFAFCHHEPSTNEHTTWKVILKALRSKAFKITHFSVLARRNRG